MDICLLPGPTMLLAVGFFFNRFIYLFLAALGLCCCSWAFSSCGEWGLIFSVVHRLLMVVASLVEKQRLEVHGLQ